MAASITTVLHQLVLALDRSADGILSAEVGLSWGKFYPLLVLNIVGEVSQHDLAVAMGHSDPAVSKMLGNLSELGYVSVSAGAGRKRIASLTPHGREAVRAGEAKLNYRFERVVLEAGVNASTYQAETEKLIRALKAGGDSK